MERGSVGVSSLYAASEDFKNEIRARKEHWVHQHPEATDLPVHVFPFRGGDRVGEALLADPHKLIDLARAMAFGTAADEIILLAETYTTPLPENPKTEMPWESGELEFMANEYPESLEQGWVAEAITVMAVNRDGVAYNGMFPFRVEGDTVIWDEEAEAGTEIPMDQVAGAMQMLMEIMNSPHLVQALENSIGKELIDALLGPDGEKEMVARDFATISFCMEQGLADAAMLAGKPGTERVELIKKLMEQPSIKEKYKAVVIDPEDNE
jgi:hypothetical protein